MEWLMLWPAVAIASAVIASSKNRSGFGWLILGFMFPLLALIVVAVMPAIEKGAKYRDVPDPDTHVKCPDCRELVLMDARRCKHCGCPLVPQKT